MDVSKYWGVQTAEMDRTDAFLPTLFMWDFTCQQCYPPYTKPEIQAGIQVLHATEMGISLRQTRAGKILTFHYGAESYPLLQDVLILPMRCLWVHGDLGFDQWDSEWLVSGRSSGFLQPNALAACWHSGTGCCLILFFSSRSDWKRDTRSCTLW